MKRVLAVSVAAVAAAVAVAMAGNDATRPAAAAQNVLNGPSPAVGVHAYLTRPEQAPSALRAEFAAARQAIARGDHGSGGGPRGRGEVFNGDTVGLPQNEESVNACRSNRDVVLEGTNDYRFILDPQGNSTGWHFSNDGGRTLTNEGLLPALAGPDGSTLPSGGDPVDVAADGCDFLYAGDLNYDATQEFPFPSGVGIYRSTPRTLAGCPQGESNGGLCESQGWQWRAL